MTRSLFLSAALLAGAAACDAPSASDPAAPAAAAPAASAAAQTGSDAELEAVWLTNIRTEHPDGDPARHAIRWTAEGGEGPIRIEASADPAAAPGEGRVIGTFEGSGSTEWTAPEPGTRHYFLLVPERGEPVRTAARLLPLEGGRNFRDLGGYATEAGRTVRWGQVFRSGAMHELTDGDKAYLRRLGIRTVCDYRTAQERAEEPTDWQAFGIDTEYVSFPDPEAGATSQESPMIAALLDETTTPEEIGKAMAEGYSDIAYDQAPAYRRMFDELAAGNVPLAFNCSAGKDRAGTSAALLLTALGVPRDTVVHDYSLSDDYVDYMAVFLNEESRRRAEASESAYAFLFSMPPERVAPLMASDPAYIQASFSDLEEKEGSVMDFVRGELDVTDAELEAIRAKLLE